MHDRRVFAYFFALVAFGATQLGGNGRSPEALATVSSDIESSSNRFELRPGVMIDSTAGVAYLMNPQRGIDAIDLASGKTLWSTRAAAKPIALFDGRLAAQAESKGNARVLPIVVLDTSDGKVVSSASIAMPGGAWASIDEGLGTSFKLNAAFEQEHLLVVWSASRRTISGIARPGPPPETTEDGAALIDLKTGHVETLSAEAARSRLAASAPPVRPPRTTGTEALLSPPQAAGKFFFATGASKSGGRPVLKRWSADSAEPLPDVELGPGFGVASSSADGAMVMAAKPVGADAAGIQNYLWSIYSLSSGEKVAEIKLFPSTAPFFLWRSNLIYVSPRYARQVNGALREEPLALRALNSKSGTEVWKASIRDTAFRGPTPPVP